MLLSDLEIFADSGVLFLGVLLVPEPVRLRNDWSKFRNEAGTRLEIILRL